MARPATGKDETDPSTLENDGQNKALGLLASRLEALRLKTGTKGRKALTWGQIAKEINGAAGDEVISPSFLYNLANGTKDNPTRRHLAVLAAYFGTPVSYFFGDELSDGLSANDVDLAKAINDPRVRALALAAAGLPNQSLDALRTVVDAMWAQVHTAQAS
jgi:transcriptional regulator with XRE-family HTH domain